METLPVFIFKVIKIKPATPVCWIQVRRIAPPSLDGVDFPDNVSEEERQRNEKDMLLPDYCLPEFLQTKHTLFKIHMTGPTATQGKGEPV